MSAAPMDREQVEALRDEARYALRGAILGPLGERVDALCSTALAVMDERNTLRQDRSALIASLEDASHLRDTQVTRIAVLERTVKTARVRMEILLDRMRGCDEATAEDFKGHGLSLFEGTDWLEELAAALSPPAPQADAPAVTPERFPNVVSDDRFGWGEYDLVDPVNDSVIGTVQNLPPESFAPRRGGSRG